MPPTFENALTLDSTLKNEWGDVLPRIEYIDHPDTKVLREAAETQIRGVFDKIATAGGGKILQVTPDRTHDHPGGGCRMGNDPEKSVVNSIGRTHDHENLWVVGAPTFVTGGCCNGTLTMVALTLRSAVEIAKG